MVDLSKVILSMDMFSLPLSLFAEKRNSSNKRIGSYCGFTLTIVINMGLLVYLCYMMARMMEGIDDQISSQQMVNNFEA